MRQKKV